MIDLIEQCMKPWKQMMVGGLPTYHTRWVAPVWYKSFYRQLVSVAGWMCIEHIQGNT